MTFNEILAKLNFVTKIQFKYGDEELSKELRVKIMRMRIAYGKIKKQFDNAINEFKEEAISPEVKTLLESKERTIEEDALLKENIDKINEEIGTFIVQKVNEQVESFNDFSFTEEEYDNIVEVNSMDDVVINNQTISGPDFLEGIYVLFVK